LCGWTRRWEDEGPKTDISLFLVDLDSGMRKVVSRPDSRLFDITDYNVVPRYSLCERYIYLGAMGQLYYHLETTEEARLKWPFRKRRIGHEESISLDGHGIIVAADRTSVDLVRFSHETEEWEEDARVTIAITPASLRWVDMILLTGDTANPELRLLFMPTNSPPEMRYLPHTFGYYLDQLKEMQDASRSEFAEEDKMSDSAERAEGNGDGSNGSNGNNGSNGSNDSNGSDGSISKSNYDSNDNSDDVL
jgi:hypothetical protein